MEKMEENSKDNSKITDFLTNEVGYALSWENHELDNSYVRDSIWDFLRECREREIEPEGIEKESSYLEQAGRRDVAFVFRYKGSDDVRWSHLPVCVWEEYLEEIFPDKWEAMSDKILRRGKRTDSRKETETAVATS